ncbi:MAG: hypothetical protein WCD43_00715 [Candidatus Acidiferrales bacterium]
MAILSFELYDFGVKSLARSRVVAVLFLFVPLSGCMGWGDMFAPRRPIAGDYYLMQGEAAEALYLFVRGNQSSIAGPVHRIGWNHQYIIYTDDNKPTEWNVIAVKEHTPFTINDVQRAQDSRFQQIVILSWSDAWEKSKSQNSK